MRHIFSALLVLSVGVCMATSAEAQAPPTPNAEKPKPFDPAKFLERPFEQPLLEAIGATKNPFSVIRVLNATVESCARLDDVSSEEYIHTVNVYDVAETVKADEKVGMMIGEPRLVNVKAFLKAEKKSHLVFRFNRSVSIGDHVILVLVHPLDSKVKPFDVHLYLFDNY